jgi:hypothetical protein
MQSGLKPVSVLFANAPSLKSGVSEEIAFSYTTLLRIWVRKFSPKGTKARFFVLQKQIKSVNFTDEVLHRH